MITPARRNRRRVPRPGSSETLHVLIPAAQYLVARPLRRARESSGDKASRRGGIAMLGLCNAAGDSRRLWLRSSGPVRDRKSLLTIFIGSCRRRNAIGRIAPAGTRLAGFLLPRAA
jgi:hypothetical protein